MIAILKRMVIKRELGLAHCSNAPFPLTSFRSRNPRKYDDEFVMLEIVSDGKGQTNFLSTDPGCLGGNNVMTSQGKL